MYEVKPRTEPEADFSDLLSTLQEKLVSTPRVIVYCQTLMMCADLFAHFSYEMGSDQYYPLDHPSSVKDEQRSAIRAIYEGRD